MWIREQGWGVQGAATGELSCAPVLMLKLVVALWGGLSCRLTFTTLQLDSRQDIFPFDSQFPLLPVLLFASWGVCLWVNTGSGVGRVSTVTPCIQ